MFKKKTIAAALACALALGAFSGSALASPIIVDGVQFDPDRPNDLTISALHLRESQVDSIGDVLMGYGQIASINANDESVLCAGCDLTFTFKYTVKSINGDDNGTPGDTSDDTAKIVFDTGSIDFYVDDTDSFNVLDPSTAGKGSIWLRLSGHTAAYTGYSVLGQLYSTTQGPVGNPKPGSIGFGLLDVLAGTDAAMYFNTDSQDDGSDFTLNSSFQFNPADVCTGSGDTRVCYPISGGGQLIGDSRAVTVPEPGALGLLGLGLGGLGLLIWRRRTEAEKRA